MPQSYDVVVIGGGHNGLVNAAYLAKAGKKGVGFGAAARAGRSRGHRRNRAWLPVFRMFLRGFAAAAGNYPRTGSAAAWAGNPAAGRHVFANAERRLFVARERPRKNAAGNPPAFAHGCGSIRRILEDDDADVPVREADAFDDSAGPDDAQSEGPEAVEFPAAAFPRAFLGRTLHADPVDDHELGGFSGPVV